MSEINKLLNLAFEDLETAEFLFAGQRYRSCLSRAYYAMYYSAQALLLSENIETSTHKGVIKLINLHFVRTKQLDHKIFKLLNDAYDLRQLGDYSPNFTATSLSAREAIDNAQIFINEINKILNLEKDNR
ncbi:HEPN domain-containing protein [Pseudanabaena sp. ABRG5-3]|uniref:HEPN domain-containing protein n=1 Tax=Pseudanabaena sp. ABRG5-3 TaxID=685565 RepID=UPI000DC70674|nr:HEPN domain-containing protein [Pseudanabaena sp. ABRG5-3]BBC23505.1 HEPN domain protein [Pseudanabaena sp. ABRG5-3]